MAHTIRALSFDADNCLFHSDYDPTWSEIHSGECLQVITKNKRLLDVLKTEKSQFKQTIVLVGSLRQSVATDKLNARANTTESIFVAIQKVAQYLEATLDKFLLSDIYAQVAPGTSFDLAIDAPKSHQNTCVNDTGKAALLYAQMHKLANQYPNEPILFDFYDDRGFNAWSQGDDILEYLRVFFEKNTELLPQNVTLRLNHYEGSKVTSYNNIKGTGFIDVNYPQTTQDIALVSQYGADRITEIKPSDLLNRKQLVLHTPSPATDVRESSFPTSAPIPDAEERQTSPIPQFLGSLFYQLGFKTADLQPLTAEIDKLSDSQTHHVKGITGL
ncbi:MAG: hypothetical protein P1U61_06685 [Legionellaceae bacterium]|nr:hypothetical protein [Legionellaceae bacterium]